MVYRFNGKTIFQHKGLHFFPLNKEEPVFVSDSLETVLKIKIITSTCHSEPPSRQESRDFKGKSSPKMRFFAPRFAAGCSK